MKRVLLLLGICLVSSLSLAQSAGDIIITEWMANPAGTDPGGEYFEIYNTTNNTINVDGWVFRDEGSDSVKIDAGGTLDILPKGFLVFGRSTTNPSQIVNRDYIYSSGFAIGNGADEIILQTDTGVIITRVDYTDGDFVFLNGGGQALELSDLSDHVNGVITQSDMIAATDTLEGDAVGFGSPGYAGNTDLDVTTISGDAGWRMLSLPKTGGVVTDVSDDSPVQGIASGTDATADTTFYINPSSSGSGSDGWTVPTDVSTPWGDGEGFIMYFFNNTTNGSSELPIQLDAPGDEPSTDVSIPIGNLWTLVGNPFAKHIAMDEILGDDGGEGVNDGLVSPAQVWADVDDTYQSVNFGSNNGETVAAWLGFFIQRSGIGTENLSIPTSAISNVSSPTITYFDKNRLPSFREISLHLDSNQGFKDYSAKFYFSTISVFGRDGYDGAKLSPLNGAPSIAFIQDFGDGDELFVQDSREMNPIEEQVYRLALNDAGIDGEYTISWPSMINVPENWDLTLIDNEMGTSTNMMIEDSYSFQVNAQQKRPVQSVLKAPEIQAKMSTTTQNRFTIILNPVVGVSNDEDESPSSFALEQNFPNPFNPSTNIRYTLDQAGPVNVSVYNMLGQRVAQLVNRTQNAGTYQVTWDASGNASGVYFYRLESAGQSLTRQMTLIK